MLISSFNKSLTLIKSLTLLLLNFNNPTLSPNQYHVCGSTRQAGFTLIEIMIVVVIIAVMSVAVSISIGGNSDRKARLQANRFLTVVNEVRDEAIISGQDYALLVDEKALTYAFSAVRDIEKILQGDALFKVRSVDADIEIEWQVFEVLTQDNDIKPKVFITALGEMTPFEMSFAGSSISFTVFLNEEGQLERRDGQARF